MSALRRQIYFFVLLLIVDLFATASMGQEITLALDIYYSNPLNTDSAGSWELVALASDRGLSAVNLTLDDVGTPMFMAPTGSGTGVATAGFHENIGPVNFATNNGSEWSFLFGQIQQVAPGPQGLFYDVGVPGGATQPGENGTPAIAGFSGINVPWAYDDQLGDFVGDGDSTNNNGALHNGVLLAMGSFTAGADPAFAISAVPDGNVFTVLGDATDAPAPGTILQASVSTTVRDNTGLLAGDANMDGIVDVSDLNVWNSNKFTNNGGWRNGDFNGDKSVDVSDFNIWNANKFTSVLDTVPEPSGLLIALFLAAGLLLTRRTQVADSSGTWWPPTRLSP